jgi:hypothetical protein
MFIEEVIDMIIHLRPDIKQTGIYQTFNQKLKLMITSLPYFKKLYIGRYYCPELIYVLLKEVIYIKFGIVVGKKG